MARTPEQRAKHAAAMRAWRAANPEASRAVSARRDAAVKADPERAARSRAWRNAYMRGRYRTHRDEVRRHSRNSYLRTKYGIEPAEYAQLLDQQGSRCAICSTTEPGKIKQYFTVDHDHETGKRRGLLCDNCNRGIGLLGDDVARLLAAVGYLRAHANPD